MIQLGAGDWQIRSSLARCSTLRILAGSAGGILSGEAASALGVGTESPLAFVYDPDPPGQWLPQAACSH